ncbi:MAG: helix-turn-helix transcriptional regulator, partial [Chryseobacterium sp.]|nr:helix-turn-helix transcriptional regulator [Chryseobacterium sp.]
MSTKDRKLKERENRKEFILSAAFSIMEKYGIYGLNLDLIAKETDLAKGTIYLYFKSKEEIISTLSLKARILLLNEFKEIANKNLDPL